MLITRWRVSPKQERRNAARTFLSPFMWNYPGSSACLTVPQGCATRGWRSCMSSGLALSRSSIRIHETNRIRFRDIVIEQSRQKKPLGPTVSLNVAQPASLLCMRGRLSCRVSWHKEFSHRLSMELTLLAPLATPRRCAPWSRPHPARGAPPQVGVPLISRPVRPPCH